PQQQFRSRSRGGMRKYAEQLRPHWQFGFTTRGQRKRKYAEQLHSDLLQHKWRGRNNPGKRKFCIIQASFKLWNSRASRLKLVTTASVRYRSNQTHTD